jgi:hypothetical protein
MSGFLPEKLAKELNTLIEVNRKHIFPSDEAVVRVEQFLHVLYKKIDKAMVSAKKKS